MKRSKFFAVLLIGAMLFPFFAAPCSAGVKETLETLYEVYDGITDIKDVGDLINETEGDGLFARIWFNFKLMLVALFNQKWVALLLLMAELWFVELACFFIFAFLIVHYFFYIISFGTIYLWGLWAMIDQYCLAVILLNFIMTE